MSRKIRFDFASVSLEARLLTTPTADAIWAALPLTARASTWGDEVYFSIPVNASPEADARDLMQKGEIAFWLDGHAIAICFGRTPVSAPGEMRLMSDANVWAQAVGDTRVLKAVKAGESVKVVRV